MGTEMRDWDDTDLSDIREEAREQGAKEERVRLQKIVSKVLFVSESGGVYNSYFDHLDLEEESPGLRDFLLGADKDGN